MYYVGTGLRRALWQPNTELDGAVDLCCYWFEKARAQIECPRQASRAGLLGTQGNPIPVSNLPVPLTRIKEYRRHLRCCLSTT